MKRLARPEVAPLVFSFRMGVNNDSTTAHLPGFALALLRLRASLS